MEGCVCLCAAMHRPGQPPTFSHVSWKRHTHTLIAHFMPPAGPLQLHLPMTQFKLAHVDGLIMIWPVWHLAAMLPPLNISVTFISHFTFSPL